MMSSSSAHSSGVFHSESLCKILENQDNIRNVALIGQVKSGKSTLMNTLSKATGLENTRADKGISTKPNAVSLYYEISKSNGYLINLIDTPGHVDFFSEVESALCLADGALVVVDYREGIRVQTKTAIQQALKQRIVPVLVINKVEHLFFLEGEVAYEILQRIIENANNIVAEYEDPEMADFRFSPEKGTVAFSAGSVGWAFTLPIFAEINASKLHIDLTLVENLWGDHFFNETTGQWTSVHTGAATCTRGFFAFCFRHIQDILNFCLCGDKISLQEKLGNLHLELSADEYLTGMILVDHIMEKWLPAGFSLFHMMINRLPSPLTAQKYRVQKLYRGPIGDSYAKAIRDCDPEGPLILYISTLILEAPKMDSFFALGRVFSGKVSTALKVQVMHSRHLPGKISRSYRQIQEVKICMGEMIDMTGDVQCGSIVILSGIDSCRATVTNANNANAFPIRALSLPIYHVVYVKVQVLDPNESESLRRATRSLSCYDPMVFCFPDEWGGHTIAGTGDFHIQTCTKYLRDFTGRTTMFTSDLQSSYRETVVEAQGNTVTCRSLDGLNWLQMEAIPMQVGIAKDIDDGLLDPWGDPRVLSEILTEKFGWNEDLMILAFSAGPSMIVHRQGVELANEMQEFIITGFLSGSKRGPLSKEPLRDVCFRVSDMGFNNNFFEFIGITMEAMHGSMKAATPRIMQPMYLLELLFPSEWEGYLTRLLHRMSGIVTERGEIPHLSVSTLKMRLPVTESFGFEQRVRDTSEGKIFPQFVLDGWEVVDSDPRDLRGLAYYHINNLQKKMEL